MKIKPLLLSALLLCSINSLQAQQLEVFLTHGGGLLDRVCRKLFSEYETLSGTQVAINVKTGADGILAARAMTSNSSKNKVLCHGNSLWVQNRFVHKDKDIGISDKSFLLKFSNMTSIWYVPNKVTGVTDWDSLISYLRNLNRPINVGGFTGGHRAQIKWLAKKYNLPLVVVPFKKGPEILPALAKGDLDLAIDPAFGYKAAMAGKFQIVGYNQISPSNVLKDKQRFDTIIPDMNAFGLWLGLTVNSDMDPKVKNDLQQIIIKIVSQDSFKDFAESSFAPVDWVSGTAAEKLIESQVKETEKVLN